MMSFDHQNSYLEDILPLTRLQALDTWHNRTSCDKISTSRLLRHVSLFLRPSLLRWGGTRLIIVKSVKEKQWLQGKVHLRWNGPLKWTKKFVEIWRRRNKKWRWHVFNTSLQLHNPVQAKLAFTHLQRLAHAVLHAAAADEFVARVLHLWQYHPHWNPRLHHVIMLPSPFRRA